MAFVNFKLSAIRRDTKTTSPPGVTASSGAAVLTEWGCGLSNGSSSTYCDAASGRGWYREGAWLLSRGGVVIIARRAWLVSRGGSRRNFTVTLRQFYSNFSVSLQ